MNKFSNFSNQLRADEKLTAQQTTKIKGGDDKYPPLPFPLPLPPLPRPNGYQNNNNQY